MVTGADSVEEAFFVYSTAKSLLKEGGFNLCKFCSNDGLLQSMINSKEARGLSLLM